MSGLRQRYYQKHCKYTKGNLALKILIYASVIAALPKHFILNRKFTLRLLIASQYLKSAFVFARLLHELLGLPIRHKN
jgi:hypothetical protein